MAYAKIYRAIISSFYPNGIVWLRILKSIGNGPWLSHSSKISGQTACANVKHPGMHRRNKEYFQQNYQTNFPIHDKILQSI